MVLARSPKGTGHYDAFKPVQLVGFAFVAHIMYDLQVVKFIETAHASRDSVIKRRKIGANEKLRAIKFGRKSATAKRAQPTLAFE